MGCGGSTDKTLEQKVEDDQTNPEVSKPRISVRIDPEVRVVEEVDKPKILFVFGGPGSRKGRIIDDLVRAFGFIYLNAEDIVMEELPKKLDTDLDLRDARHLQDILLSSPEHFTFDWIIECIKERIEPNPDNSYLIDIVPNRRLLSRNELNAAEACKMVLRRFEDKYPVSFALNLAVPKDKVLEKVEAQSAIQSAGAMNGNGRSDEVDVSRMQRRLAAYEELARNFLSYFEDRMCTVDVSCGVADLISLRVSQLLNEMNITPIRSVNTVVLFSFTGADYGRVEAKQIQMKDFIVDQNDEVNLLRVLSREIDRTPPSDIQVFAVNLEDTVLHRQHEERLAKGSKLRKRVLFLEEEHDNLDDYVCVQSPGSTQSRMERRKSSVGRQFRSLSTNGNEVCLFPMDADLELCIYIAKILAEIRDET